MKFGSGPRIHLQIDRVNGAILASRLSLSDNFSCSGADRTLLDWLESYTKGIILPLPLIDGTSFQERVLQTMQKIPFGKTMSYGELASLCGSPKAARAVGNACNRNLFPLFIPCHRVIQADGKIGGFASDLEIKRRLLIFEASRKDLPQQ